MFFILLAQAAMPDIAIWFMLLFVFVGALMAGFSVPLVLRRVKPNSLYGFRTSKTLSNERIWYEANAYAGRLTLGLGVAFALVSIVLYFLLGANFIAYNLACASVLLVGFLVVAVLSFRYLRSLSHPTPRAG
jgi:uncharacterized membrane protein